MGKGAVWILRFLFSPIPWEKECWHRPGTLTEHWDQRMENLEGETKKFKCFAAIKESPLGSVLFRLCLHVSPSWNSLVSIVQRQGVVLCLSSGVGSFQGRLGRAWAKLWGRGQGAESGGRRFKLVTFSFRLKLPSFCPSFHDDACCWNCQTLMTRARRVRLYGKGFTPIIYSTILRFHWKMGQGWSPWPGRGSYWGWMLRGWCAKHVKCGTVLTQEKMSPPPKC